MGALGLSMQDGKVDTKNMTQFLTELRDSLERFTDVEKAKILEPLFGKQAIAGVIQLTRQIPAIKKFEKSFRNAGGEVAAASARIGEALPNKVKTLASALISRAPP